MSRPLPPPSRSALREHLVDSRIAGDVATPRENNLRNFRLLAERAPLYTFGLSFQGRWDAADVLAMMAERCGVSPDPAHTHGQDRIDPDLTLDRLDDVRDRLQEAAAAGQRVLVATGHPSGILAIHLEVAAALAAAGCTLLTPAAGFSYRTLRDEHREIRHVGGVALVSSGGELNHTHAAAPMEGMLAELADREEAPPDLVVADHGWAGAAGEAGLDVVGFADCNDPALFAGAAEGKVGVCVPLDDNVLPHLYDPLAAYLVADLG